MITDALTSATTMLLLAQTGAGLKAAAGAPPAPTLRGILDLRTFILLGTVLGLLAAASVIGRVLRRSADTTLNPAMVKTFRSRVNAWWTMYAILIAGFLVDFVFLSTVTTVLLFGLVSFWALREYITMTPTRRGDHRTLFWTFFLFTPLQYVLVGIGSFCFELYTTMIPVYASLFIPARIAISGDPKRFLERVAKIQAGLLICVYALSHAPALLSLELHTSTGQPWAGSRAGLLFYFVLLVQLNDVFQYVWGQLLGKHVIAEQINSSKTWEGVIGGLMSSMILSMLLYWATPFSLWEAPCIALVVSLAGFAGTMTMSAVKRDRGVSDYGTLVQGHAGVLDRIDSICFAAPVFFHITRYFFSAL
ncbi:MAG: phosphatidate cytidylyltransferase [Pirellulaceae bacterium]